MAVGPEMTGNREATTSESQRLYRGSGVERDAGNWHRIERGSHNEWGGKGDCLTLNLFSSFC